MKVCFICPEYPEGPHGGIGSMVQIISRELVKFGHLVRVIGVYSKSYPAPDHENDMGVQVIRLRETKGKYGWIIPYVKQYRLIKSWAERGEIDIVEAPDSRGWIAFWPLLKIPVIIRANGSNTYFSKILGTHLNLLTSILERKSIHRADYIAAVSQYTSDVTKQVFNLTTSLPVIYNSIEIPEQKSDLHRDPNTIVFSGSLNRKKGIFDLVKAVLLLLEKNQNLKIKIYGKDTLNANGESVLENLTNMIPDKFSNNFLFAGHVSRKVLIEEFYKCSVAVFPSYAEAFAHAPLESMACGCPTIYSKLGSGPELISDGEDGLLVTPTDPHEIGNAIDRILKDPQFAQKLGDAGKSKVIQKFSEELLVKKSIDFYQKCINDFNKIGKTVR